MAYPSAQHAALARLTARCAGPVAHVPGAISVVVRRNLQSGEWARPKQSASAAALLGAAGVGSVGGEEEPESSTAAEVVAMELYLLVAGDQTGFAARHCQRSEEVPESASLAWPGFEVFVAGLWPALVDSTGSADAAAIAAGFEHIVAE